jgi:hypothetical protein
LWSGAVPLLIESLASVGKLALGLRSINVLLLKICAAYQRDFLGEISASKDRSKN